MKARDTEQSERDTNQRKQKLKYVGGKQQKHPPQMKSTDNDIQQLLGRVSRKIQATK